MRQSERERMGLEKKKKKEMLCSVKTCERCSPTPALLNIAGRTSRMWLGQYFL